MTQQTKTLEELRGEAGEWLDGMKPPLEYWEGGAEVVESAAKGRELVENLLAALEQAEKANEWRGVESAPREHGVKFLGWSDKYGQCLLNYNEDIDGYVERGFVLKDDVNITHWQPLPPKPQSETE